MTTDIPRHYLRTVHDSTLSDMLITRIHVISSINMLKDNSSAGPDGLPSKFFKAFCVQLANPLQKIFQMSFDSGVVPSVWKCSFIQPIFKGKGKDSDPACYRPISLTCIMCKIFERILKWEINKYIIDNNIITNHQHGFLSKKSTQTQLIECTNDWSLYLDQQEGVDVIYLDISKAFDTVSHPKLLHKLDKYGLKDKFHNWLRSYLSERTQQVRVNGSFSSKSDVTSCFRRVAS